MWGPFTRTVSRDGKFLLDHFFPFYPQARCLPCGRETENVLAAGSARVLKSFYNFIGSQWAIMLYMHTPPFLFSGCFAAFCFSLSPIPSFLSSSRPLIPFGDSQELTQHSTGRDELKQRAGLQLGRDFRVGNWACFTALSCRRWGLSHR